MPKKYFQIIFTSIFLISSFFVIDFCFAMMPSVDPSEDVEGADSSSALAGTAGDQVLEAPAEVDSVNTTCTDEKCTLPNPLGEEKTSVQEFIGKIINAVLGVVGSIALLMFIYGGFLWLTAAGKAENVKKGQEVIIWAVLGLVVIFTSYALVRFVITSVSGS
jgi:hypothetical protein